METPPLTPRQKLEKELGELKGLLFEIERRPKGITPEEKKAAHGKILLLEKELASLR